ncbi:hypothetical protein Q7P37_002032 [Cladosporium fusiforme]
MEVASSCAGIASLAIQLMESSQKLHALYHTSKDAPDTVVQLSFELATLSKHIRQLERLQDRTHQSGDADCEELLGCCIYTCARMSAKIKTAVDKVEHSLQKSRLTGRVYMAFKEPEIRKLLEEMEQAKTSMILAHLQYIESWKVQQTEQANVFWLQQQSLLASQYDRLTDIERTMSEGQAAILARITSSADPLHIKSTAPQRGSTPAAIDRDRMSSQERSSGRFSQKFRISLPRWFTNIVWDFGTYDMDMDNVRTFQLRSINIRPKDLAVFQVVRSGSVERVRKLLASGDLSLSDRAESDLPWHPEQTLLMMAAENGHTELCKFLFHESAFYREETTMQSALQDYIRSTYFWYQNSTPAQVEALYHLFIKEFGLFVDIDDVQYFEPEPTSAVNETILNNSRLTTSSLEGLFRSQPVQFLSWPFAKRFSTCLQSQDWPAETFLKAIQCEDVREMITRTDSRGRTALHWAAEHMGSWFHLVQIPGNDITSHFVEYGTLVSKLIRLGADAHAFDSDNRSPFLAYFSRLSGPAFDQEDFDGLASAARKWGDAMTQGGLSLTSYVEQENQVVTQLDRNHRSIAPRWCSHLVYIFEGFELQRDQELIMQVARHISIGVWEWRPPPGTWNGPNPLKTISSGRPENVIDPHLWVRVNSINISLGSYLVDDRFQHPPSPFITRESWRAMFSGTQDDNGPVARIDPGKAALLENFEESGKRRRANSLPIVKSALAALPLLEESFLESLWFWNNDNPSVNKVHKCLHSSKWTYTAHEYVGHYAEGVLCTLGLCSSPRFFPRSFQPFGRVWKDVLISEDEDVEKVRRFVNRFGSEWDISRFVDRLEKSAMI